MSRATTLVSVLMLSACGSNIEQIRFSYPPPGDPPTRPVSPRVVDGTPIVPSLLQRAQTVQAEKLPDFRKKTIGFAIGSIGSPVVQGLSLAGALDLVAPLLGGLGNAVGKAVASAASGLEEAAERELRLKLALSLLRAGATRFIDLRLLRNVAASASGQRLNGLTLQGSLDQLALLGLYDRIDVVLAIPAVHCTPRAAAIQTPQLLDPKDAERYRTEAAAYPALASAHAAAVDRSLAELGRRYHAEVERFASQWGSRTFWQRFGDAFRSAADNREEAEKRMRRARAQLVAQKDTSLQPLPSLDELTRRTQRAARAAQLEIVRCSLGAMLIDARGPTLWAHEVSREAMGREAALDAAIDALVASLLAKSGLKRAKVEATSTAVPLKQASGEGAARPTPRADR